jgi:hypothetical protein
MSCNQTVAAASRAISVRRTASNMSCSIGYAELAAAMPRASSDGLYRRSLTALRSGVFRDKYERLDGWA